MLVHVWYFQSARDHGPLGRVMAIVSPHDERFVAELKSRIPSPYRWWFAMGRLWIVAAEYRNVVVELVLQFFGKVRICRTCMACRTWDNRVELMRSLGYHPTLKNQHQEPPPQPPPTPRSTPPPRHQWGPPPRQQQAAWDFRTPPPTPRPTPPPRRESPPPPPPPPRGRRGGLSRAQAARVLGVAEHATPREVKAAFARLALARHPDTGGSHEAMVELNAARDAFLS